MTDNEKEAEDITKFEELKESWVNDEIDTLTYITVLNNRLETLEAKLAEVKKETAWEIIDSIDITRDYRDTPERYDSYTANLIVSIIKSKFGGEV